MRSRDAVECGPERVDWIANLGADVDTNAGAGRSHLVIWAALRYKVRAMWMSMPNLWPERPVEM